MMNEKLPCADCQRIWADAKTSAKNMDNYILGLYPNIPGLDRFERRTIKHIGAGSELIINEFYLHNGCAIQLGAEPDKDLPQDLKELTKRRLKDRCVKGAKDA